MFMSNNKNNNEEPKRDLTVLVVGGGSFGTCMAHLLAGAGQKVKLWVRRLDLAKEINQKHRNSTYLPKFSLDKNLEAVTNLSAWVPKAQLILMAVPSLHFRDVARDMAEFIQGDQCIVHLSKGLELKSAETMSQILRQETCALKIGAMAGPNLAVEIMLGAPAGAVVASKYDCLIEQIQSLFCNTRFRVYASNDLLGVELAGAFKNIIALVVGAADGLGFGMNSKALLLTRGIEQMTRFGLAMGANPETFMGLAGVGDVIATALSPLSRNHQVGKRIAQGESLKSILASMTQVAEGVSSAPLIAAKADELKLDLSLLKAVVQVLQKKTSIKKVMAGLIARQTGRESILEKH